MDAQTTPRLRDVRRRFDRAAATFDGADFVHRHVGDGLLTRLAPVELSARRVLELGSATGTLSRQLARRFRRARIVSLDLSHGMLRRARRKRSRFARISEVQADAAALPLPTGSVDAVVCNLLLPWIADLPRLLDEVARVLRKDGVFGFTSLGPDSLVELREAWGDGLHVNRFVDMHDVGDALLHSGLRDPVLDVDRLEVSYRDTAGLYHDLAACGARNTLRGRQPGLTGKRRWQQAEHALNAAMREGALHLQLELVYGHAFGGGPRPPAGEFHLGVDQIGRRESR